MKQLNKDIIGMIHCRALTGTPKFRNNIKEIISIAIEEAKLYQRAGVDILMIENMHDVPYIKSGIGHEVSTLMTLIGYEIKRATSMRCGIQILAAANKAAIAAAKSADLDFIRAEGFVYGHVADEGYIDANGGELLRYRKYIDAEDIAVFTDIKKKHSSHQITQDVSLVETAKTAEYFLSDGLIITGSSTGHAADLEELEGVKKAVNIPVLVGSGVTIDNVEEYLQVSDALIVGSWFKKDSYWANKIDENRVKTFMDKVKSLR